MVFACSDANERALRAFIRAKKPSGICTDFVLNTSGTGQGVPALIQDLQSTPSQRLALSSEYSTSTFGFQGG